MDKTNRIIKICRRIEELERQLSCGDMMLQDAERARYELNDLEIELELIEMPSSYQ